MQQWMEFQDENGKLHFTVRPDPDPGPCVSWLVCVFHVWFRIPRLMDWNRARRREIDEW